jgi:hypothetical protein
VCTGGHELADDGAADAAAGTGDEDASTWEIVHGGALCSSLKGCCGRDRVGQIVSGDTQDAPRRTVVSPVSLLLSNQA